MELANTSRDYYIDFVSKYIHINESTNVFEIGCGDGGNLLPFAEKNCKILGVDLSPTRTKEAKEHFSSLGYNDVDIQCFNFLDVEADRAVKYDLILIHDVIEHIEAPYKDAFFSHVKHFLKKDGIIFWRFPAWQMPFGGHQQICKNKFLSTIPFYHLLPLPIFSGMLRLFNENEHNIKELISIKKSKMSIENFEHLCRLHHQKIINRQLWFINPHYKQKFNLNPRKLSSLIGNIPYIRNFFSTSCYYITKNE
jgi:SAM-dependent methyltransferase